jgi:hypothetical protein
MAHAQSLSYAFKEEIRHAVGVCFAEKMELGAARSVLNGRGFTSGAEDGAYTAYRMKLDKAKKADGFWTLNVRIPNIEGEDCVISVLNISPANSKNMLFLLQSHIQRTGFVSKSIPLTSGRNISGYTKDGRDIVFVALPRGRTLNVTLSDPN